MRRPPSRVESLARARGFRRVAGVDEAGRGPLAGPVVAAACILPSPCRIPGIACSKLLTAPQREVVYEKLTTHSAVSYAIGIVDHVVIDRINILQATLRAMCEAIDVLEPDYLLIDGINHPHTLPGETLISGERRSLSIAAASIIAKVTRDRLMLEAHVRWPEYGFASHKGYGTAAHREALARFGPCPIHRLTFAPCAAVAFPAASG